MDWSIQQIARLAGTTSRTLRHYADVGLLEPSRIGANGYRYYDAAALTRLQRILLLRALGLGLPAIAEVFEGQRDDVAALRNHREWLQQEMLRINRQLSSVETTIRRLEGGEQLMAEDMFDGFEHTVYTAEVEQRWGAESAAASTSWWSALSLSEQKQWQADSACLTVDWADAASRGIDPASDEAQLLARRQYAWLAGIPGTPQENGGPTKDYFVGLGELYVADERFAKNYGGMAGAEFVRATLAAYAAHEL